MKATNNEAQEIEELKKEILRLKADLNIERNAKNQAYSFMISNELFQKFVDFCEKNKTGEKLLETIWFMKEVISQNKRIIEVQDKHIEILENELKNQCFSFPINRAKSKHLSIV